MIPITTFLTASVLAKSNPTGPDNDEQVSFSIARSARQEGKFDKFFNSSDHSLFLTKMNDRKVVIVSSKLTGDVRSAAILRVTNSPHLRFGVEWGRNQSFIDGKRNEKGKPYVADTFHAVRFLGMHEVNENTNTLSPTATQYLFRNMTWSEFEVNTTTVDGAHFIDLNTTSTSGGLTFTFIIHVSDTPNATLGVNPFGIKYDFHISGNPVYNLQNSHFRLLNLVC